MYFSLFFLSVTIQHSRPTDDVLVVSPNHAGAPHVWISASIRIGIHFLLLRLEIERGISEEVMSSFRRGRPPGPEPAPFAPWTLAKVSSIHRRRYGTGLGGSGETELRESIARNQLRKSAAEAGVGEGGRLVLTIAPGHALEKVGFTVAHPYVFTVRISSGLTVMSTDPGLLD
jgi:hypothetical protein